MGGPGDGGEGGVGGAEEAELPGGEAEAVEVLGVDVGGDFADVFLGGFGVHPEGVVDVEGGAADDAEGGEAWGGIGEPVLVLPIEDDGVFGEGGEDLGVFEDHVSPDGGGASGVFDFLDEGLEVPAVEPGFGVFGGIFAGFGVLGPGLAAGAAVELGGFVAADMDERGVEGLEGLFEDVMHELDEGWFGGAALESGERFFAKGSTFFGVEEAFDVSEEVDEGDDLEAGELGSDVFDGLGGEGMLSGGPGSGLVGEAVFGIEAEGVVSGVEGVPGVSVEDVLGGALLSG